MSSERRTPTPEEMAILCKVVREVARAGRLRLPDQEDFSQSVHLKLLERNYEVFERFRGGSSLRTYLTVVVKRMLLDWRNTTQGKWRPSAMAARLGRHVVRLECLIHRDGFTTHEAVSIVGADRGAPSAPELLQLAEQLPRRLRRRHVSDHCLEDVATPPSEDPIDGAERRRLQRRTREAIAIAIQRLPLEDRKLVCLRYGHGQSIQSIARLLPTDAKALYRRCERILRALRTHVETAAGIF